MSDTMASPPQRMQRRLEKHFGDLRATRDISSFPIFALEHGLKQNEVEAVRSMLRSPSGRRFLSSQYWLLWVVYATELGYDYAGDEYWVSFEEKTPTWEYHDRAKIKVWFRKFTNTYGGVFPSGPWADHFSIIAWPITHAVLPLYLQRQFAKLLYDLRFRLASPSALATESVGRLLSVHASHTSTRFKAFLEQEDLTGQIVAALLGGNSTEVELIHPPTLQRITADLERVRNTREWLKETRQVVSDRFKGIGRGAGGPAKRTPSSDPTGRRHLDTSHLAIRPNLLLRYAGTNRWSAFLEVKSFRPVATLSAEIHKFLDRTRCRLNGADDFKPTGWLLSGNRKGTLRSWPDSASPLVRFEQSHPVMDHLLESEFRLHPGPTWLFRIGADGLARHVAGRIVRPDFDYVVVTTLPPMSYEGLTSCSLDCTSVDAYRLAMPSFVSTEMTDRLKTMHLHVARTIRVWPAGLPGRGWDGEGSSEWLTTESPCFGIAPDHSVESLSFCLDDEPENVILRGTESTLFVRLPPLPPGKHTLTVKARRSSDLESIVPTPPAEGFIRLAVREPEPWIPGVTSHSALVVRVDPDHADLDALWRNEASISVNGPEGFDATFFATLHAADGREILSEQQVGTFSLPVTPHAWHSTFGRFVDNDPRPTQYLEAVTCTLTIRADKLGSWTRRFEHQPLPVRWTIRPRRGNVVVRLVDDSGLDETDPDVSLYSMERPFQQVQPSTLATARSDYHVEPPGGLFVVEHGQHLDAVLVSVPVGSLRKLDVEPSFPGLERSARRLAGYLRLLKLWHDARLFGFLAALRHRKVVGNAIDALRNVLCGDRWAKAENHFRTHPESQASLDSLAALVDKSTSFGNVLRRRLLRSESTIPEPFTWFVNEAARNSICQDRDLSEFALRFATKPLLIVNRHDLEQQIAKLIDNPAILRAARLLTLLTSSASKEAYNLATPNRYST